MYLFCIHIGNNAVKNNSTYNRSNKEQEIKIDIIGVLAEMIALHHLLTKEKDFDYSVLLSKNPAIKMI